MAEEAPRLLARLRDDVDRHMASCPKTRAWVLDVERRHRHTWRMDPKMYEA